MHTLLSALGILTILLLQHPKIHSAAVIESTPDVASESNKLNISESATSTTAVKLAPTFIRKLQSTSLGTSEETPQLAIPQPQTRRNGSLQQIQQLNVPPETIVVTETKWLKPSGFPLWLAILILTTVGGLLALASLVCSIKFKQKERQLQTLRARLKQQQQQQGASASQGGKYGNQRCMCLIALDQQRHKLQTSDVDAVPSATTVPT